MMNSTMERIIWQVHNNEDFKKQMLTNLENGVTETRFQNWLNKDKGHGTMTYPTKPKK